ncbi:MAG: hypothetical protein VR64_04530 [Desulfatitalea sp. BRH_c12]|nr:MAG: hypothetical protein VR64_04530 [Desulfatitalea sp. BRH_c12]
MNRNAPLHLTRDERLKAVVDIGDIDHARRSHLATCDRCRDDFERLHGRLERLGRVAATLAPKPKAAFRLPARQAKTHGFFRPVWAIGISALLVAIVIVWPHAFSTVEPQPELARQEDRQLITSIENLVIDALPAPYQGLVAWTDPPNVDVPDISDDVRDWFMPSPSDQDDDEWLS